MVGSVQEDIRRQWPPILMRAALQGNILATKMILDRFLSTRKDRIFKIDFSEIQDIEDFLKAYPSSALQLDRTIYRQMLFPSHLQLLIRNMRYLNDILTTI